jgi:hypothetical protein
VTATRPSALGRQTVWVTGFRCSWAAKTWWATSRSLTWRCTGHCPVSFAEPLATSRLDPRSVGFSGRNWPTAGTCRWASASGAQRRRHSNALRAEGSRVPHHHDADLYSLTARVIRSQRCPGEAGGELKRACLEWATIILGIGRRRHLTVSIVYLPNGQPLRSAMPDLEVLFRNLVASDSDANHQGVPDEVREFIEAVTFASPEEILQSLRRVLSDDWMGLPVWARNLSYRLVCLQRPDDPGLLREAAADLLCSGPDWDDIAEELRARSARPES